MNKLDKVLYTAHATSTGGREGTSKTSDGSLNVKLTTPKELGGNGAAGVNPEQLFAMGYSACFIGAIKAVGMQTKTQIPADTSINASVGIGPIPQGFGLQVALEVHIPGMEKSQAQALVEKAHQICPYSNATRGNIEVKLSVV